MALNDDNKILIHHFLDKAESKLLIIYQSISGALVAVTSFPNNTKNKAVYFVKR